MQRPSSAPAGPHSAMPQKWPAGHWLVLVQTCATCSHFSIAAGKQCVPPSTAGTPQSQLAGQGMTSPSHSRLQLSLMRQSLPAGQAHATAFLQLFVVRPHRLAQVTATGCGRQVCRLRLCTRARRKQMDRVDQIRCCLLSWTCAFPPRARVRTASLVVVDNP